MAFPQAPPGPSAPQISQDDHILGIIPNYETVYEPHQKIGPLTVGEKFDLFTKETFAPFTAVQAATGSAISQSDNDDPKYGYGTRAYAERFGAGLADITTQNLFSDAVLASVLHEDPRYFRLGPGFSFWSRVAHALDRVVITRNDAGYSTFNYSGVIGTGLGVALSNAYYPAASVNGAETAKHFGTSIAGSALFNLLPEFWPDIRWKLFHKK